MKYPKDTDIKYCPCCASDNIKLQQLDNGNSVGISCNGCNFYTAVDVIVD